MIERKSRYGIKNVNIDHIPYTTTEEESHLTTGSTLRSAKKRDMYARKFHIMSKDLGSADKLGGSTADLLANVEGKTSGDAEQSAVRLAMSPFGKDGGAAKKVLLSPQLSKLSNQTSVLAAQRNKGETPAYLKSILEDRDKADKSEKSASKQLSGLISGLGDLRKMTQNVLDQGKPNLFKSKSAAAVGGSGGGVGASRGSTAASTRPHIVKKVVSKIGAVKKLESAGKDAAAKRATGRQAVKNQMSGVGNGNQPPTPSLLEQRSWSNGGLVENALQEESYTASCAKALRMEKKTRLGEEYIDSDGEIIDDEKQALHEDLLKAGADAFMAKFGGFASSSSSSSSGVPGSSSSSRLGSSSSSSVNTGSRLGSALTGTTSGLESAGRMGLSSAGGGVPGLSPIVESPRSGGGKGVTGVKRGKTGNVDEDAAQKL
jgi:hypothetical protein